MEHHFLSPVYDRSSLVKPVRQYRQWPKNVRICAHAVGHGVRDWSRGGLHHGEGLERGLQILQGVGRHPATDPWLGHEAHEAGPQPSLEQGWLWGMGGLPGSLIFVSGCNKNELSFQTQGHLTCHDEKLFHFKALRQWYRIVRHAWCTCRRVSRRSYERRRLHVRLGVDGFCLPRINNPWSPN